MCIFMQRWIKKIFGLHSSSPTIIFNLIVMKTEGIPWEKNVLGNFGLGKNF